jgi:mono/diheme cytochrome c family protein
LIIEPSRFEYDAVDQLRERVEGQARTALLRLCTMAGKHGVPASLAVEWDRPPHEAIVRRATEIGADLIIAECHKGARTRPWLIHLTDWELLRTSPLPVLLLKGAKPYHRPLVLAAVDPAHSHAKPLALDTRILAAAGELGKGLRGTLHVMHANHPSIVGVDPEIASKRATSTWSTLTFKELQDQERQAFEDFRARAGVPRTRAHLVNDNPAVAIARLARRLAPRRTRGQACRIRKANGAGTPGIGPGRQRGPEGIMRLLTLTFTAIAIAGLASCNSAPRSRAVTPADALPPAAARALAHGARSYKASCAACHGERGRGDGPVAAFLTVQVADLTRIAARRSGSFPEDEVYRIIDGQADLAAHGPRHMPVWGYEFFGDDADDEAAHGRASEKIERLVHYLRSIQRGE